jgi:hypothetical protein
MAGQVFFSYVHTDNENDLEGIARLVDLLKKELSLLAGEPRDVWIDKAALGWGADWKQRIEEALLDTSFFVPVVTPAYFKSAACRDELLSFASSASRLGLEELILPLYYVTVPGFGEGPQEDEAVALVAQFQYVDWRELRVTNYRQTAFRRQLKALAEQLLAAETLADAKAIPLPAVPDEKASDEPDEADTGPGLLDKLADGEAAMHRLTPQMEEVSRILQTIGQLMGEASLSISRSDAQGRGFAGRLTVSRQLAKKLEVPASEFEAVSSSFAADLLRVGPAMDVIFDQLNENEDQVTSSVPFLQTIVRTGQQARVGFSSTTAFADVMHQSRNWSKELRPPLRRIETATRQIGDAQRMFDEWQRRAAALLDRAGQPPELA